MTGNTFFGFGTPGNSNLGLRNLGRGNPGRNNQVLSKSVLGLLVALGLAGCSSASSGLTTGSILPGAAKPADPVMDRTLQVGATSARAAKCGYNFDPQKLKANYLAYETSQPGADAAKIEKVYDVTRASVAAKIPDPSEYCNDEQTTKIKGDLTRHLAGDFNPPPKKIEATLADVLASKDQKPWNPQDALCPNQSCR